MADMAVAGGLMPHQKDEHDIWICRSCGWKYPNAKPSAKIRKNHKKHCPATAGTAAHADEGSSDDKSDDDHHLPLTGTVAPKEIAVDAPVPQVKTNSRDFDLASLQENLKSESAPAAAPVVNGAAKEAPAQEEATTPAAALVSPGGLMPHQKDEHDVWICKECGWKYPNAKPSPKIRKNHKKHCPGRGGPELSDEASDEEPHFAPEDPAVAVESGREESDSSATALTEAPISISREIDLTALKESPSPEVTEETSSTDISADAGNGTEEFSPVSSEPAKSDNAIPQDSPVEIPLVAESEKEDPASAPEVLGRVSVDTDFAVLKEPSNPAVKNKTPAAGAGKTSPAIPGRKRTTLQTTAKPPWRY